MRLLCVRSEPHQEGAHHRPALQRRRIDHELLGILAGRQHQCRIGRDAAFEQARPQNFYGLMVVTQNEQSASDAEMFPAGLKALGLGKVVSVPTMAAVIGTGSYTLLDGPTIRCDPQKFRPARIGANLSALPGLSDEHLSASLRWGASRMNRTVNLGEQLM